MVTTRSLATAAVHPDLPTPEEEGHTDQWKRRRTDVGFRPTFQSPSRRPVTARRESLPAAPTQPERPGAPQISFVIPGLNESESLPELAGRIARVMEGRESYEILFVDDGSTDRSWQVIRALAAADDRIKGVRLRRNFGKAMALKAGFRRAAGDVVVTMDADLQDDPTDIPLFLAKIEQGEDVVVGWKTNRQDPVNRLLLSRVFNGVVRWSTGVHLHDMNCGFKAYRREVVQSVPIYGDLFRFFPAMAAAEGFRIAEVPVTHHPRAFGKSRYGLERILRGFLDLLSVFFLTRYQRKPMHLFGLLGVVLGSMGVALGGYLTAEWLGGARIGDRPLLLLSVLLVLVGLQLFSTGLIGEFLTYQRQKRKAADFSAVREHTR